MSSISSGLMITISWFNVICPGIFPVVPMYITAEFWLRRHAEFIRLNLKTFFFEDGTELPRISLPRLKFYWIFNPVFKRIPVTYALSRTINCLFLTNIKTADFRLNLDF